MAKFLFKDGIEISFVKEPSELQLECSICLQLLTDPCLLDCECGSSFCRQCINSLQTTSNSCPLCNQQFSIVLPSKQLSRTINGLLIQCPHHEKGCEWTDSLSKLEDHFNKNPSLSARLDGCGFTQLLCKYCAKLIARKEIVEHESELCPQKPFSCEYCGHESVLDDITTNHWPVCEKIPVPCPLECGDSPPRGQLEDHVTDKCGFLVVDCEYKYAGCLAEVKRADMADHLKDNVVQHTSMLSAHQQDKVKYLTETLATVVADITKLTKKNQALEATVQELRAENLSLRESLAELKAENKKKPDTSTATESTTPPFSPFLTTPLLPKIPPQTLHLPEDKVVPLQLKMTNYAKIKQGKNRWTSAPFYSPTGHQMVLSVEPYGKGVGEGTHISCSLHIVKGEYDHKIKWPFTGSIVLYLCNPHSVGHRPSVTFAFGNFKDCGVRKFDNKLNAGILCERFLDQATVESLHLFCDSLTFLMDVCQ